jgi:hypothetical protein
MGSPVTSLPGTGAEASYALAADGLYYAWGENDQLQLGTASRASVVQEPAPVMIEIAGALAPLTGVAGPIRSGGTDHCIGVLERLDFGASHVCWGTNDWGEVGAGDVDGARTSHQYPVPMLALPATARELVRGEDHGCGAVSVNGRTEIWCYGRPGVLGNGAPRAEDGEPPGDWLGAPVVWDPANFASALE